jgi:nicotinamide mononucleotide transporter
VDEDDFRTDTNSASMQLLVPLLAAAATGLALFMAVTGRSSKLETFSVITGAACVWLTVRASAWNFPVSLVNVAAYSVVYFQARLFADAGLQVVFFVLTLAGWFQWLYGGTGRTALRVGRASRLELVIVVACVAGSTLLLSYLLNHLGGSATFFDAFTTSLSLGGQWLLNRKRVENWWLWIVADVIYVPLYTYKHLYLTAFLYAVFLAMATAGLIEWVRVWRREQSLLPPPRGFEVVQTAVPASEQVPA